MPGWLGLAVVLWLLAALPALLHAQNVTIPPPQLQALSALRFRHLTTDDGLPNNRVEAMLQDRRGFMWFGTADGLARYDGYRVVTYKRLPENPNSLSNNIFTAHAEDVNGALLIGTREGGLNRLDPHTHIFTLIKPTRTIPRAWQTTV